jgi:hypothetical protein
MRLALTITVLAACGKPPAPSPAPPTPATPAPAPAPVVDPPRRVLLERAQPWHPPPDVPPPVDVPFLREPGVISAAGGFVWTEAPPFLVLAEYKQADVCDTGRRYDDKLGVTVEEAVPGTVNPAKVRQNLEWRAQAPKLAERTARLLTSLHARFRELLAEPLGLPEIPAGRRLVVIVARNKPVWDAWERGASTRSWAAEFRVEAGATCAHFDDNAYMHLDEWRCAGNRVQKEFDQDLCFAVSLQLFQEYASLAQKRDARSWSASRPVWLVGGLASFMSGVECDTSGVGTLEGTGLAHNRLLLCWIASVRSAGLANTTTWSVEKLLAMRELADARTAAVEAHHPDIPTERITTLIAARWWAFAHFSWFAHDGKHRRAFLDVARHVLEGTEKPETATASYGLASPADFAAIEADFDEYWAAILERKVGRNQVTKQWFEPSTGPPIVK